jgi:hypothetical protein
MVAGNQVNMQVHYGLPGGFSIVYSNIKPIGVAFFSQDLLHLEYKLEKSDLLRASGLKKRRYMPLGDDQRVTWRYRGAIRHRQRRVTFEDYVLAIKVTKWALGLSNQLTSPPPTFADQTINKENIFFGFPSQPQSVLNCYSRADSSQPPPKAR